MKKTAIPIIILLSILTASSFAKSQKDSCKNEGYYKGTWDGDNISQPCTCSKGKLTGDGYSGNKWCALSDADQKKLSPAYEKCGDTKGKQKDIKDPDTLFCKCPDGYKTADGDCTNHQ